MGNVCCGGQEERTKASALESHRDDVSSVITRNLSQPKFSSAQQLQPNDTNEPSDPRISMRPDNAPPTPEIEQERRKKLREEQARLDLIVQATGRAMVSVRSTRGSNGYYDQGFAAALAAHLEATTAFPDTLERSLPPPIIPSRDDLQRRVSEVSATGGGATSVNHHPMHSRLSQAEWEGIALGPKDGLAGCAGENPITYFDHLAEQFLDSKIPKKERMFANAEPIMENLL